MKPLLGREQNDTSLIDLRRLGRRLRVSGRVLALGPDWSVEIIELTNGAESKAQFSPLVACAHQDPSCCIYIWNE